jgi:hypothetical protein
LKRSVTFPLRRISAAKRAGCSPNQLGAERLLTQKLSANPAAETGAEGWNPTETQNLGSRLGTEPECSHQSR